SLYTVDTGIQFTTPFELNAVTPTRLVLGTNNGLYESTDQGDNLTKLNLGTGVTPGFTRAIAYGGAGNADVIYFGGNNGATQLMVRTTAGGAFTLLSTFPGFYTRDIAVDPSDWRIAYVIDFNGRLWRTLDAGATSGGWTELTGNFNTLDGEARSITALPGVVLVGGRTGAYFMRTSAVGVWRELGTGMPNVPINDLRYNAADDVVTSGTVGRGAWSIGNLTASLAEAIAPLATIAAVVPNPRNSPLASLAITFTEAVNGFDLADLGLTRNGLAVPLNTALQTLSTVDGIHWVLGNLASLTAAAGSYTLTLNVGASGIFDGAGNALAGTAASSWTVDLTAPTAVLGAVSPDPRASAVDSLPITFSEAVTGFDLSDLVLTRNGVAVSLAGATLSGSGSSYTLNGLTGLTGGAGTYVLRLAAAGSGILDAAGNALTADAVETWQVLAGFDRLVVDAGTSQRSMVRSLTVVLQGALASAPASAFSVRRVGGGPSDTFDVAVAAISSVAGNRTEVRLTFTGTGLAGGPLRSLPDGLYELTVDGGQVLDFAGFAVDSDGDGVAGGLRVLSFHRFFGDGDGNGLVDAIDYAAFRAAYLTGNAALYAFYDSNGDGVFNSLDLDAFNANFRRRRLT
ncbi:MAG TPA: Ig-like domain-containing protein, partial [Isosphaeraceae bacterium]